LIGVCLFVFSRRLPSAFVVFPPAIWAALRFRQLGATVSGLIVSTIAVIYVENDLGPFVRASTDDSLLLSQAFTAVAVTTGLVLAAVTSERDHAEQELRAARRRLEETVEERTAEVEHSHRELELQALIARNMTEGVCLVRASDSRIVYANPEFERMFGYRPGELNGVDAGTLGYRHGSAADAEAAAAVDAELGRAGEATYEVLNRHKDGTAFWSRVHSSSFNHPEHGDVWVAVHEDVTERKRAEILERSFVPEKLPDIPGVQLAARFIPGGVGVEVGGDWYDVQPLDGDQIALVIGDVAGRGVPAAAVMSQLRNGLRAFLFESHPPAVALQRLNAMAWSLEERVMATLVYMLFEPASGRLRVANAGHLPPLLVEPGRGTRYLKEGRSLPLGVRPATRYGEAEYVVDPGSTILLYTDGLVERRGITIDDGLDRLARGAEAEHDGLDTLCDQILAALAPSGEDDVALLALAPTTLAPERLDLVMPARPAALAAFRRALRLWLEACDAGEEEAREVVLACNEAFSNAVEHAYGPDDGTVETIAGLDGREIQIVVRDFGRWRAPRGENRGRGLLLMEKLMDSVQIDRQPEGTEVHLKRMLKGTADGA
jgi:PAS domain S-box-containing protein